MADSPRAGDAAVTRDGQDVHEEKDGTYTATYTVENRSENDIDFKLRDWPHASKEQKNWGNGQAFDKRNKEKDENKNPDIQTGSGSVKGNKKDSKEKNKTKVTLKFPKGAKPWGYYVWVYTEDKKHPVKTAGDFHRHAHIIWDVYGPFKGKGDVRLPIGPGGEFFNWTTYAPYFAFFPQKVYNLLGASEREAARFVITEEPKDEPGWDVRSVWPVIGIPFALNPWARTASGIVRIQYPRSLPEGYVREFTFRQDTVGHEGDDRFSVFPFVRTVVDSTPPEVLEWSIDRLGEESTVVGRITSRDDVSGISDRFMEVSVDRGGTWGRVRMYVAHGSAIDEVPTYEGVAGPFPSGFPILVRLVAVDGVGNAARTPIRQISFARVIGNYSQIKPASVAGNPDSARVVSRDFNSTLAPAAVTISGMPTLAVATPASASGLHEVVKQKASKVEGASLESPLFIASETNSEVHESSRAGQPDVADHRLATNSELELRLWKSRTKGDE